MRPASCVVCEERLHICTNECTGHHAGRGRVNFLLPRNSRRLVVLLLQRHIIPLHLSTSIPFPFSHQPRPVLTHLRVHNNPDNPRHDSQGDDDEDNPEDPFHVVSIARRTPERGA